MKKSLQGNSATASQNLAACRNAARNLLRLNGADAIAVTFATMPADPGELQKLMGILKN